jgi:cytochrome c peroxidase
MKSLIRDSLTFIRKVTSTSVIGAAVLMAAPPAAHADFDLILTPHDARAQGLESLRRAVRRDGVPLPTNLDKYVKNRAAAIELGKALFWDMQLGSDGVMACASCHFHAGADSRATNQFNPDRTAFTDTRNGDVSGYQRSPILADLHFDTRQPNETIVREDFPLVRTIESVTSNPNGSILPGPGNSNDIVSSMGTVFTLFNTIVPGSAFDSGSPLTDTVWTSGGKNVRRVEPRNAPSVINAVFNYANFWDGRANPHFNGNDSFGDHGFFNIVVVNRGGALVEEEVVMDTASLASQALTPLNSFVEMAFGSPSIGNGRDPIEVGLKLLRASPSGEVVRPLARQKVDRRDSVLGHLSNAPAPGIATTYQEMIQRAFVDDYWNSSELVEIPLPSESFFTEAETNFAFFFGVAIALYEATLVSDETPFDRWMETGRLTRDFGLAELAGLNLFVNQGKCISCHAGPELTKASVRNARGTTNLISAMPLAQGSGLYDTGFYNIGVTPTTDDVGRGGQDVFGSAIAFSRQALFQRLAIEPIDFPILGNEFLPAKSEDRRTPVCNDTNTNGVCDPGETILPEFQRVAVDGAFKTPGLRNVELTGPYFHNGGVATLRQVVQFYNRGGNFCRLNARDLDTDIKPLRMVPFQERALVSFLLALTDQRVKFERAPFDHPEIRIPNDGFDLEGSLHLEAVGSNGSPRPLATFLALDPQDSIFTPSGVCTPASAH